MGIEKYFDIELGLLKTEYCEPFYTSLKFTEEQKTEFRKQISFNILAKFLIKLDPIFKDMGITKVENKEEALKILEDLSNNPEYNKLADDFTTVGIETILNEWHKKFNL